MEENISSLLQGLYSDQLPTNLKIGGINSGVASLGAMNDSYGLLNRGVFLGTKGDFQYEGNSKILVAGFKPSAMFNLSHLMFSQQIRLFQDNGYQIYLTSAASESTFRKNSDMENLRGSEEVFLRYLFSSSSLDSSRIKVVRDLDSQEVIQLGLKIATKVNLNYLKRVFGYDDKQQMSLALFPLFISANYLYPQIIEPGNSTLILATMSHNPLITFTREVAERFGYLKPNAIYGKCLKGVSSDELMSSKNPSNSILLSEDLSKTKEKLKKTKTGGISLLDQRVKGGDLERCNYFMMHYFGNSYNNLESMVRDCRGGISCGECKQKNTCKLLDKLDSIKTITK